MTNYAPFKYECDVCGKKYGDIGIFLMFHPQIFLGKKNGECWCICQSCWRKVLKEDE